MCDDDDIEADGGVAADGYLTERAEALARYLMRFREYMRVRDHAEPYRPVVYDTHWEEVNVGGLEPTEVCDA